VTRTEPVYPPIAKAAHVSGDVKLQIQIDSNGHVVGSKVISGPPMLVGAAQDCVKQWVYEQPKVNDMPTPTSALVTVSFTLPPPVNPDDEKIAAKFFPMDQACIKAVGTNAAPEEQATQCREAAQLAETFSPQERFIERRSAFVYASTALRRNKQLPESLDYANKAVAVVEQGHDDGSGSSAAYATRAQVYAQLGDLNKASDDLATAEQFERDAIAKMLTLDKQFVQHSTCRH
jgi:TonB family protein